MNKPFESTGEKLKTSDQDTQSSLNFTDVVPQNTNTPHKSFDQAKATQDLVEKKILAPVAIIKERDGGKGNPLRNKGGKKKKGRGLQKFERDLLRQVPAEKLALIMEKQASATTEGESESIEEEIRKLVKTLIAQGEIVEEMDEEGGQKEIARINPSPNHATVTVAVTPISHAAPPNALHTQGGGEFTAPGS